MQMNSKIRDQIDRAYRIMARLGYRPGAPSDGYGNITAPLYNLDMYKEIQEYADEYWRREEKQEYWLGCPDGSSRVAFILAVEAARLMAAGESALARTLMEAAVNTLPVRTPVPVRGG